MIQLNIEDLLKRKKLSKEKLCKSMNITRWNLNKAIKSRNSISYKYLEGFCKHLDCSFDELLTIIEDNNDEEKDA